MKTPFSLLLSVFALTATNASSATKTWDGSTSAIWNVTANWEFNSVPVAGDDMEFPAGAANKAMNNNLATGLLFQKLVFSEGAYSLTGSALSLTADAADSFSLVTSHASGTVTIQVPVSLATRNSTWSLGNGGALTISGAGSLSLNGRNLALQDTGNLTMTSAITGAGAATGTALSKTGSGTLTLSANNNYTGTTSFTAGEVVLNGSLTGGGAVTVGDNATLTGNNGSISGPVIINGTLSPGTLTAGSRGKLTFNDDLTFSSTSTDTRRLIFDMPSATTPGTSYDQIVCAGAVTGGSANLTFDTGTSVPPLGTVYILVSKTSAGAISGTFRDASNAVITEGATRPAGLMTLQFSYTGGAGGNDFTATVVAPTTSTGTTAWNDSTADHLFSTAQNWQSNQIPAGGRTLVFGALAPLADRGLVENDLGGHFFEIQFTDTGYTVSPETLAGNDVTLSNGINATASSNGTNSWATDIHLAQAQTFSNVGTGLLSLSSTLSLDGQDLTLHSHNTAAGADPVLRFSGFLDGTSRITKTGSDRVEFSGTGFTNWGHTGEVVVEQGELRITRTIGVAPALVIQGPVTIGGAGFAASLTTTAPERILDTVGVTVNTGGTFAPGAAETVGSLTIAGGSVNGGANKVIVDGNITTTENSTISGLLENKGTAVARQWSVATDKTLTVDAALTLNGTATVNKTGAGTLILNGAGTPGAISVAAGKLTLNSALTSAVNLTTATTAVLDGTGTAAGFTITSGTISPAGSATGILTSTATLTGGANGTYLVTGDASAMDKIMVASLPSPGTMQLAVSLTGVPLPGTTFTILENTGSGAIQTRFRQGATTLNEGSTVTSPQGSFTISYAGGSGNDVTLTSALPAPTGATKVWSGAGGNSNWSTPGNWTGGAIPVAGDTLEFPGAAMTSSLTNDMPVNMTFQNINFTGASAASNRTIPGNALRVLGSITHGWTGTSRSVTFSIPVTMESASNATLQASGTGNLTFGFPVTVTGNILIVRGDGSATQRTITFQRALTIAAAGTLFLRNNALVNYFGTEVNVFGTTNVEFGGVSSSSTSTVKIPGALIVGDNVNAATASLGANSLAAGNAVTVNTGSTLTTQSNTVSNLTFNGGGLNITNGSLTVQGNVAVTSGSVSTSLGFTFPTIAGGHTVNVAAGASLVLDNLNGGSGAADQVEKLGGGLFQVNTSLLAVETMRLSAGELRSNAPNGTGTDCHAVAGTLSGTGAWKLITGTGGTVSPGASAGLLTTTSLDLAPAMTLSMEIGGPLAGTHHDQLTVASTADLENATLALALTGGHVPLVGQAYRLIDNTGASAFSGTFTGIPQNGTRSLGGGVTVQFSYTGGTGNDFTATVTASPAGSFRVWDGGGPDANWMTAANWTGDVAPLPGEALRFPTGAPQTTNSNNFPADTPFNGIKIEADYTLNGARVLLKGTLDAQPPGTATLGLPLLLRESRTLLLAGGGSLIPGGIISLDEAATLTLRNNSAGEINVSGRILELIVTTNDGGVIVDGTGLVKLNSATGHNYKGDTWVQRGILELTGASSIEVPANLRIGGAGFTARVENPAGTTVGRIDNTADLILETGGTHAMTGATPLEKIGRLIMRGGSLEQPAGGQLIALDRIHAEGGVASTITTPVFLEASIASDIDVILVESGSSLTFTQNSGYLFNGSFNPKLRKIGAGPVILQASLTAEELDCWEGTVVTSGASGVINGRTILNGGTVTGNGLLNGLVSGVAANVPVGSGSPGGGTLTPSGPGGTGPGLLTCAGNFLPVTVTHVAIEIGGAVAGTLHDQLQVNGALDLNRCVLDLSLINGFIPSAGQAFTILTKASAGSPTPRPFAGLDQGTTFSAAGQLWSITYIGGDGNDVVITAQGVAPTLDFTAFSVGPPAGGGSGVQVTASITGPASTLVNLEASNDLVNWTVIGSTTTSGAGIASFNITDAAATGPRRFYQATIP